MNRKKGITLAETVVAMAVIAIVSVMAYTTCSFAISQDSKNKVKSFFINQTQNFVNCYFLGNDGYYDAFKFLTGEDANFGENITIYYDKKFEISNEEDSKYHIDLNFENSNENYVVECYINSSQDVIYQVEV